MKLIASALVPLAVASAAMAQAPASGRDVLQRMHDAYAGKWYHTLTFRQTTTIHRQNGSDTVMTWYESLRHVPSGRTELRIDFGDPANGNGVLYTADSSWRFRNGAPVGAPQPQGNEFLPLIEGVYVNPVDRTLADLREMGVDMSKVTTTTWEGRPAWVVGTMTPGDSVPQFWVDTARNVLVRMFLTLAPGRPPADVRLGDYVQLGGGWLATRVAMLIGTTPVQLEEYADWKSDVPLTDALFDPAAWVTPAHWARPSR